MRAILRRLGVIALVMGVVPAVGCDDEPAGPALGEAKPDPALRTHEIQASTPTAEGLAYIEAIAAAHREADAATGAGRVRALKAGMAIPVPADLPEAEILRLELATRLAEVAMESPGGESVARELLEPMLEPERSLPLDRSTSRALVVLGDAAAKAGDDALAAGSYARSVRMMSILRQELER